MKGIKKLAALMLVAVLALGGCTVSTKVERKKTAHASFFPIADFTKRIVKDKWDVNLIVDTNEEPHDYELTPEKIKGLASADLIVYNGLDMEEFIEDLEKSMEDTSKFVEASKGITPIKNEEDHDHDDHDHDDHDHDHDDHDHEHGHHHHHDIDPHVWLSIPLAIQEMSNIKDKIIELDPENKDFYEKNFEESKAEFEKLHQEFKEKLAKVKQKNLVTSHEAFAYLAKEYGLTQVGISGLSPEDEPSPAKLAEIVEYVKKNNIKVIFAEELASKKVVETLANEANVKMVELKTLEALSEEDAKANKDYLELMRDNLETLTKYLNE